MDFPIFENIREQFTIPNAALFSFPGKSGAHRCSLTPLSLGMSLITVAVQQSEQCSCAVH